MKDVKRLAKSPLRNNTPSDPNVKCSSCKQTDHKSSRSPLCANHVSNKIVFFYSESWWKLQNLYQTITSGSTCSHLYQAKNNSCFSRCKKHNHQNSNSCQLLHTGPFKPQEESPSCVFKQNSWYSMDQPVNSKRATDSNALPRDMLRICDTFRADTRSNNNAMYNKTIACGVSRCLTETCIKLSTSY